MWATLCYGQLACQYSSANHASYHITSYRPTIITAVAVFAEIESVASSQTVVSSRGVSWWVKN